MTDNEIIKALEYCSSHDDCDLNCPIAKETTEDEGCIRIIGRLALDIINRQKAEIERLKLLLAQEEKSTISLTKKIYKEAKSEARKEFVERLKERATKTTWISGGALVEKDYKISREDLDKLLAKMEGGND